MTSRQCFRRSCPGALSDHGCEPSTFGAQRRQPQPPSRDFTASAQRPITTTPSDLLMPPQLVRGFSRYTPRASNAALRETSRCALAFFAGTAWRRFGQLASAASQSAATSCSPRPKALALSCSISSRSSFATRSIVQSDAMVNSSARKCRQACLLYVLGNEALELGQARTSRRAPFGPVLAANPDHSQ